MERLRTRAVALLATASLLLVLGYSATFWPGGVPMWVSVMFAVATVAQLMAFCVLGAVTREGRLGAAAWGVLTMGLLVGGALVYAIVAPDLGADEPLLLGLPRRAAVILYGVGVGPLAVLAMGFVKHFREWAPPEPLEHERHEKHEKHGKHGRHG